jgi:asparagine synthase (glutamine-hydrolysing)
VKGIPLETRLALTGDDRVRKADRRLDEIFTPYFRKVERASPLNRMLYADAKVWLPEDLLLKADKMTMAAAIELRVPFLDHKLVEYIAGLPDNLKVRDYHGKWLLRRAIGAELPPAILHRTKKGFPMPAGTWFRFELRDFVRDTLLARNSACGEFFDRKAIEEVVSRQETGEISGHQEVWSLLVFEFWRNAFVKERALAQVTKGHAAEVDVFSGRGA